jgi:hypothetical protein
MIGAWLLGMALLIAAEVSARVFFFLQAPPRAPRRSREPK